jgi:proteasome accessory factor A
MGTETEYGVILQNANEMDPVSISMLLVNSFDPCPTPRSIWDYAEENPLMDARGFEMKGEKEHPSPEDNRAINRILPNGGRFYVDYAHPEYSTPECTNARDLVIYEKAGDRVLEMSRKRANQLSQGQENIRVYKNNSDGKGNSYGCHENYLMSRQVPFDKISEALTPFLVTRQIFTGAGKVGSENQTEGISYQISQRADFFETHIGLDTMSNRPIINTRDEPHAVPEKYRRLHVIVGDSNMNELAIYLKVGTTAIVLSMIEDEFIDGRLALLDPVQSLGEVSYDLSLKSKLKLKNGAQLKALEVQREYLEAAHSYYSSRPLDAVGKDVLARWEEVLDKLAEEPMQLSRQIDWITKKELLENYLARHNISWDDHRVNLIDLQYHDIRPDKGLYYVLERGGHVDRIIADQDIQEAIYKPPTDTRAYFRGVCLSKYPDKIYGVGWSSISVRAGEGSIKKIPTLEPAKGSKELVGEILDKAATVEELLSFLVS